MSAQRTHAETMRLARELVADPERKTCMDLEEKLKECEAFYNLNRPHAGKTPDEVLKEKIAA